MPPLILHNVPDEELYTGEDGVQRPYAVLFPGNDNPSVARIRRPVPETGSFGKSTRRSRSRTGTPAAVRREDPTLAAADNIFGAFVQKGAAAASDSPQRKNTLTSSVSQPNLSQNGSLQVDGTASGPSSRYVHKEPTEVILRGFRSSQQYAAIREYERIGGRICEDYPRDAPLEQRRYKADLREPSSFRRTIMTPEEKAKALKFAGGEHWIKITFESAEGAEAAIEFSPQTIHGHLVYAEIYRGVPPTVDEAVPATFQRASDGGQKLRAATGAQARQVRPGATTLPRSFTTPSMRERGSSSLSLESTQTLDTNTLSDVSATASSATVTGITATQKSDELVFCARIPTAKRMQLLPAEQALLPQTSYSQKILSNIPLIGWLSGDVIGSSVPRTETGEFDWQEASIYWKLIWWLDAWTGWFEIVGSEKEE